jgi:hypothetical protein
VIEVGKEIIAAANNPGEQTKLSDRVQPALLSITEASGANSFREILSPRRFNSTNPPEPARPIYEIKRQSKSRISSYTNFRRDPIFKLRALL